MTVRDVSTELSPAAPVRMIWRIAGLTALIVLCCSMSGRASAAGVGRDVCAARGELLRAPLVQVPFELIDGRVYVQADVDGRGPFRFAVDTGASGMARADASLVKALGLAADATVANSDGVATSQAATVALASITLGGLRRDGIQAISRDYNAHQSADAAFAGILAREFFADGLLAIDYPHRTLNFIRAQGLQAGDRDVLGYTRAFRVPVSIAGTRVEGNLDTGANVAFVLPEALYRQVSDAAPDAAGAARLANGTLQTGRATVHGPFEIGQLELADVDVRVSDRYPEVLVGAHALQHSVLMIDQRSSAVAVCR